MMAPKDRDKLRLAHSPRLISSVYHLFSLRLPLIVTLFPGEQILIEITSIKYEALVLHFPRAAIINEPYEATTAVSSPHLPALRREVVGL